MVICTMMRMLPGIMLRIAATAALEAAVTRITATHMVMVVSILLVTARAEQIPSTCRAIGLFEKIGVSRTSVAFA